MDQHNPRPFAFSSPATVSLRGMRGKPDASWAGPGGDILAHALAAGGDSVPYVP